MRDDVVDVGGDEGIGPKEVAEDGVPVSELGKKKVRLLWYVWFRMHHFLNIFVTQIFVCRSKLNAVQFRVTEGGKSSTGWRDEERAEVADRER